MLFIGRSRARVSKRQRKVVVCDSGLADQRMNRIGLSPSHEEVAMTTDIAACGRALRSRLRDIHLGLTIVAAALASPAPVHAQSPTYPAAQWRWAGVVQAGGLVEV